MMSRLSSLAALLAVLAAVAALVYLFTASTPGAEPVTELLPDAERVGTTVGGLEARPIQGGVYGGVVMDQDGRPIAGARVLLVAYGAGGLDVLNAGQGADDGEIPVVGDYKIGGEAITDPGGKFRIAADSQSLITRVLAYHTGHFLSVVEVARPREDLLLTLQRGGRVIGTVVEANGGTPVPRARVDIYLQQRVAKVPELQEGQSYPVFKAEKQERSWLATLGRFVPEVLGPRIWDIVDSGQDTLRLYTDANGHFEIGPLGNSVQLEFVVTHPKFKWSDFDTDDGKHTAQRTVVEPGETIERTFRLKKGEHVAGQVLDDTGKGIPDVFVKVQSISAYYRHWWYRSKWRRTRTDSQGRFRVDGLSIGDQEVILEHSAFKSKTVSVAAGTEDLTVIAERFGALLGRVEGVGGGKRGRRVLVLFESTEDNPRGERQQRRTVPLNADNEFLVQRVPPGKYRVWVKAGKESSQPVKLEIEPLKVIKVAFEVGRGGGIAGRVIDEEGGILDPASVRLIAVVDGKERAMGIFVTRQGELDVDGISPGSYRLRVQAPGRIPFTTEIFEVGQDRRTNLPPMALKKWGYLKFAQPVNESGRPARLEGQLILEYSRDAGPWEAAYNVAIDVCVEPGSYRVRARSGAQRYEGRFEVVGGGTTEIPIVLTQPR